MTAVEGSFSVATGNKYNYLLDDVEDPDEIFRLVAEQKKAEPKQKKKPKEAKPVPAPKSEEAKPQGRSDFSEAKRGRRDRPQDGRSTIPRFSNDRDGEGGESQRPASRGFGSRGGGNRRAGEDGFDGGNEEGGRGRGRGRGGENRGRGRGGFGEGRGGFGEGRGGFGEGRGGFGRGGGEARGRGRGFGQRGGFGQRSDADRPAGEEEERPAQSGGFGRGRGGFGRGGFANRPESAADGAGEEEVQEGGEDRPRGRGRGFGRGGRGGRGASGFSRGGRGREYERHSGSAATGVKPVEKRDGGGSHNWGTVKDDMDEQLKGEGEHGAAKDQDWAETVEQEAAEAGAEQQTEKMMTLEEWKRQQAEDRAKLQSGKAAAENSRKVDTSSFKEMTAYKKERIQEQEEDSENEDDQSAAQMIAKKSDIETNFFYNNPQGNYEDRRRGGRGGRGGRGRGDFSRGAERGGERGGERGAGPRGRGSRGGGGAGPAGGGGRAEFRVAEEDFPNLQ